MNTINFWPILVASIVGFGVTAFWYSPFLFGKEWMELVKLNHADMESAKEKGIWKSYIVHFISTLITFGVLAFAISSISPSNASDGAFIGFIAWLGFIATFGVSDFLWRKTPFKLVLIDSINILVILAIGGAIIGAWK